MALVPRPSSLVLILLLLLAGDAFGAMGTLGVRSGGRLGTAVGGLGVLGAAPGGGGGGSPPAHNPPASPLFLETFDPAGYLLTSWTEQGGGTLDEDYTGVVLDGTQTLRLVNSDLAPCYIERGVSAIGNIFLFFEFQLVEPASAEIIRLCEVQSNVSATLGHVELDTGTFTVSVFAGATSAALTTIMATGQKYYCWFQYNKNNGANRIANFGFSTTDTRPTSGNNYAQASTVTSATDVAIVTFGITSAGFGVSNEVLFDYALADDAQIGDNP